MKTTKLLVFLCHRGVIVFVEVQRRSPGKFIIDMTPTGTKHMNLFVKKKYKYLTHSRLLTDTEAQWTIYQSFTEHFEKGRQTCT